MKTAIYKEVNRYSETGREDYFLRIFEGCDTVDTHRAEGALMRDCFDENGMCIFNEECRDENDPGWSTVYIPQDEYCVSLKEHRRRLKK